eukprot:489358-Amphidinium_carterae.1
MAASACGTQRHSIVRKSCPQLNGAQKGMLTPLPLVWLVKAASPNGNLGCDCFRVFMLLALADS